MAEEIQVLGSQYHAASEAWLLAVRMHNEIRPQYIATKEGLERVKVMHTSLKENDHPAKSRVLDSVVSNFEQAFVRLDDAYRRADLECRLADETAKECKTRLEAAKRAAGYSS